MNSSIKSAVKLSSGNNRPLSYLVKSPEVKRLFQKLVTLPERTKLSAPIVPSSGINPSLVGIAFDYLFRFYFERQLRHDLTQTWIAEQNLSSVYVYTPLRRPSHIRKRAWAEVRHHFGQPLPGRKSVLGKPLLVTQKPIVGKQKIELETFMRHARLEHTRYLKTGKVTTKLLVATLRLAQLEVTQRVFLAALDWKQMMNPDSRLIRELRDLMEVLEQQETKVRKWCYTNPTFNNTSIVVKADADIAFDGKLIEVKTTKDARNERDQK